MVRNVEFLITTAKEGWNLTTYYRGKTIPNYDTRLIMALHFATFITLEKETMRKGYHHILVI